MCSYTRHEPKCNHSYKFCYFRTHQNLPFFTPYLLSFFFSQESVFITSILHFQGALSQIDTDLPFSAAFGRTGSRETCVILSQNIYEMLLMDESSTNLDGKLHFDVIASLAVNNDGTLDGDKIKDLIRTFRPNRDGTMSILDFVRSVDAVYKELRLLRATIKSSTLIDKQVERIFNVVFYLVLFSTIFVVAGLDLYAILIGVSSVVLTISFMIGSASARYFEVRGRKKVKEYCREEAERDRKKKVFVIKIPGVF